MTSSSSANWSFDSHDLSSDSETDSLLAEEKPSSCIQVPLTEHDENNMAHLSYIIGHHLSGNASGDLLKVFIPNDTRTHN